MNKYGSAFHGERFSIFIATRSIEIDGESKHIRPKTFQLLEELLLNRHRVVSKQELLDCVWDDVNVDEQVLFQAIGELRKIFGDIKIIQTYPRKGYQWIAAVDTLENQQESPSQYTALSDSGGAKETSPENRPFQPPSLFRVSLPKSGLWLGMAFVLALLITSITLLVPQKNSPGGEDMILVLPTKPSIDGHLWVYFGAMDQLLSLLSQRHLTFDFQYSLNALTGAGLNQEYASEKVAQLFSSTGAGLIVESELLGSVNEYTLVYKLHKRGGVKRGVIFEPSVNDAIVELAKEVDRFRGINNEYVYESVDSDFRNSLVAEAIILYQRGKNVAAAKMLEGLIESDPTNIKVRELLAVWSIEQGAYKGATDILNEVVQSSNATSASVHYWSALAWYYQKNWLQSYTYLERGEALAKANNNLLYQAYLAQLRGLIAQEEGDFGLALSSFQQAMTLHEAIQCPVGQSAIFLNMAKLEALKNRIIQAMKHLNQADKLIERHRLYDLERRYSLVENIIKSKS